MPQIIDLLTEQELPAECYIFKHGTDCVISSNAARVIREFQTDLPIYWVNVKQNRPMSDWVASHYQVEHDWPQLIKIEAGKPVQTLTHYSINERNLKKAPHA